jgi:hypothetical protein
MSFLNNLGEWIFGGNQNNPANAGMPYLNQGHAALNQIPGYYQQGLSPYMNAGAGALPGLQQQYGMLTSNPGGFINNMGANFKQSPGYNWQLHQSLQAANQGAAAGGYAGTPANQQFDMQTANGLANQDYYNWMNHAMGAYSQGLQGEQGLAGMGLQAGMDYAHGMSNYSEDQSTLDQSQANLAYAGKQNANETNMGGVGALLGGLGGLFGSAFGGGGMGGGQGQGQSGGSSYGMPNLGWLGSLAQFL